MRPPRVEGCFLWPGELLWRVDCCRAVAGGFEEGVCGRYVTDLAAAGGGACEGAVHCREAGGNGEGDEVLAVAGLPVELSAAAGAERHFSCLQQDLYAGVAAGRYDPFSAYLQ